MGRWRRCFPWASLRAAVHRFSDLRFALLESTSTLGAVRVLASREARWNRDVVCFHVLAVSHAVVVRREQPLTELLTCGDFSPVAAATRARGGQRAVRAVDAGRAPCLPLSPRAVLARLRRRSRRALLTRATYGRVLSRRRREGSRDAYRLADASPPASASKRSTAIPSRRWGSRSRSRFELDDGSA